MDWNVTFLTHKLDIDGGGSNRSLDLMARGLADHGCQVTIISLESDQNSLPDDPPYDVEEYFFSNRLHGACNLYKILHEWENQTDIFHIFHPAFHPIAGLYRKRGGTVPVIGRLNGYAMFCPNVEEMTPGCHRHCSALDKFQHDNTRTALKIPRIPEYVFRTHGGQRLVDAVDRLFAISPAVKHIHEEKVETDISVIPNFCDPAFDRAPNTSAPSDDELTLLYVGRLVKNKGIQDLFDAFGAVAREVMDPIRLEVVGEGPLLSEVADRAQTAELADRVSVEGWISYNDLPVRYANADIFVHTGRWPEPFGRTVLEALQSGTPALVTDIGGPPWIVGDAGMTCEPSNPRSLAAAIERLAETPALLAELRSNATGRAERFARDRVIDELLSEYGEVID